MIRKREDVEEQAHTKGINQPMGSERAEKQPGHGVQGPNSPGERGGWRTNAAASPCVFSNLLGKGHCELLLHASLCGVVCASSLRHLRCHSSVLYGDKHHEIAWMSIHPSPSRMKNGASKPQTVKANSCSVSNGCKRHGEEPVTSGTRTGASKQTTEQTTGAKRRRLLAKEQLTNATSLYVHTFCQQPLVPRNIRGSARATFFQK